MANNEINQVVVNGNTYTIASTDTNLAPVEINANSSSKSYAVGDHLVVNNSYCKVIAAIAAGDALVIGTNIEKKLLSDEIVPQALINNQLFGVGIDVLDGSLDNNRLYFVGIAQSTNCPPQATSGMGLRMMYYTSNTYWTNIVYFYHLDANKLYFNAYHSATGAWQGWQTVGGSMKVLKYGTITANTTINLDEPLDPSKYMVNLNTNGYKYKAGDGAVSWAFGYGQGAYVSAKTSTSCTIAVSGGITASYEIIQIAD